MATTDERISLEQAISSMRDLTLLNKPFSFVYMKKDGGKKVVQQALLRKQAHSSKVSDSHLLLEYKDVHKDALRHCYIPLLMYFNGTQIHLNYE